MSLRKAQKGDFLIVTDTVLRNSRKSNFGKVLPSGDNTGECFQTKNYLKFDPNSSGKSGSLDGKNEEKSTSKSPSLCYNLSPVVKGANVCCVNSETCFTKAQTHELRGILLLLIFPVAPVGCSV